VGDCDGLVDDDGDDVGVTDGVRERDLLIVRDTVGQLSDGVTVGVSDAERPTVRVRVTDRVPLGRGVTDTEPVSLAVVLGEPVDVGELLAEPDGDAPSDCVALGLGVSVGIGVADTGGGTHCQST
jgi:hypothetical protein